MVSVLDYNRVLIAGGNETGRDIATALTHLGIDFSLYDTNPAVQKKWISQGYQTSTTTHGFQAIITSPGFPPNTEIFHHNIPVLGEVELAWQLDQAQIFGPTKQWLAITGTNGKTTTTHMTEAIGQAAGWKITACGNISPTILKVLQTGTAHILAVELSSFQLNYAPSLHVYAGALLNLGEDHLDWHNGFTPYQKAKAQILTGNYGIVNADDPRVRQLTVAGTRIEITTSEPTPGQLGVIDGKLIDNAFSAGTELADATTVRPTGKPGITDALTAAALTLAAGADPHAVHTGLTGFVPDSHRGQIVATRADGVHYIDDSKATNPHAVAASFDAVTAQQDAKTADSKIVWLVGGLLKGASIDALVAQVGPKVRAAVVFGRDSRIILQALARHAAQVPTVWLDSGNDKEVSFLSSLGFADARSVQLPVERGAAAMDAIVNEASREAHPGDVVLLAPAAASMDMFDNYRQRGDLFAQSALRQVSQ